jgi:transposase-like protein
MGKPRRRFSHEFKRKLVEEYLSEKRSAAQIAAEHEISVGQIYRWRVQLEEDAKGVRAEEIKEQYEDPSAAQKRIQELEAELSEYKQVLAEKTVIEDLLKKRLQSKSSQQRSELTGLIETLESVARKRKRSR